MRKIAVPKRNDVPADSRPIFDDLTKKIGFVPNLYALIGYSPKALKGYLDFTHGVETSSFNQKEVQAINLVVSQVNGCTYCLSAHSAIGKKVGYTEEQIMEIRKSEVKDSKLRAITSLARSIIEHRGHVQPDLIEDFFAHDFNEGALVDLVALIASKSFANFLNEAIKTPIDYPVVRSA